MVARPISTAFASFTLGSLLLGSACTRNDAIVAEAPRPEPSSSASPDAAAVPPSPIVVARSEAESPKLGSPCADTSLCGTRSRVAIRAFAYHSFRAQADRPCKPLPVTPSKGSVDRESVGACVEGDHLYVESSCIPCRLPSGTVVEALVSEMTPGQASFAQARAGLGALAPLRTLSAWQDAIRDANAKSPGG